MSWLLIAVFVLGSSLSLLEAHFLRPATVVGTVYCDMCFRHHFSKAGHFISGASVTVQCEDENAKVSFYEVAKTDENGEFRVFLPFYVAQHVRKIEGCSVKSIDSGEPFCSIAATAASSSIRLTLKMPDTHIFSAGNFMFKPLIPPALCSEELSLDYGKFSGPKSGFIPPTFYPRFTEPENTKIHPVADPITPVPLLPWFPPMPRIPQMPPIPELSLPTPQPVRSDTSNEAPSFDEEFFGPRFDLFLPATLQQSLPQPTVPEPDDLIPAIPSVTPPLPIPALPTQYPALPIPFMPRIPAIPSVTPPLPIPALPTQFPALPIPLMPRIPAIPSVTPPLPTPALPTQFPALPIPFMPRIPAIPSVTPPLPIPALPTTFPAFPIPFMPHFPGFPTAKPSHIKTSAKKNSP